ncbi:MAG TPA: YceI family protein [Alphaproteobacteria bacterium]|nr:YceI family protein [Alphaproteobacteria bacterium]
MKFKTIFGALAAATILTTLPAGAADKLTIDPDHASAHFRVMHIGYSRLQVRFNDVRGNIVFDQADITKSSVSVVIKTASVDSNHKKRNEHLRSPDFFNAKEFPEMKFVSTRIEKTGAKTGKIHGNLTLLGVTKPVTLDVTFNRMGPNPLPGYNKIPTAGFSASTKIMRSNWGMKYALKGIGDQVEIWLEVEAQKK